MTALIQLPSGLKRVNFFGAIAIDLNLVLVLSRLCKIIWEVHLRPRLGCVAKMQKRGRRIGSVTRPVPNGLAHSNTMGICAADATCWPVNDRKFLRQ
jgi:hypothetical protein